MRTTIEIRNPTSASKPAIHRLLRIRSNNRCPLHHDLSRPELVCSRKHHFVTILLSLISPLLVFTSACRVTISNLSPGSSYFLTCLRPAPYASFCDFSVSQTTSVLACWHCLPALRCWHGKPRRRLYHRSTDILGYRKFSRLCQEACLTVSCDRRTSSPSSTVTRVDRMLLQPIRSCLAISLQAHLYRHHLLQRLWFNQRGWSIV